jgi:hypothetical protein
MSIKWYFVRWSVLSTFSRYLLSVFVRPMNSQMSMKSFFDYNIVCV